MAFQSKHPQLFLATGVKFMLLSALSFAFMSACVKYVSINGIPIFEIVAARACVSLFISYFDVKRKRIPIFGKNKKLLAARGIAGTLALISLYYAVATLPLAEATVLQYTHPIFTILLSCFFLNEKISRSTLISVLLSILGLLVIIKSQVTNVTNLGPLPSLSIAVALFGALTSSIAYILVKKLSNTEDTSVIIFYFPMIALPVSLIMINNSFVIPSFHLFFILILLGIFTQIGQYSLTRAMKIEQASRVSLYSYVQIVFSMLIGIAFFQESPSLWTLVGGSLIILGVFINAIGSKTIEFNK
ncbi:DMT family transporter [Vibrio sp. 10N.261.52.C2]|uniref:DMT family transporter n=1 Tax=Vibrio sp. 10N.261.52.C2 TaxID=3229681 RepID=UPI00354BC2BC